jgi:hypothetical protein
MTNSDKGLIPYDKGFNSLTELVSTACRIVQLFGSIVAELESVGLHSLVAGSPWRQSTSKQLIQLQKMKY